jgi:hypothetical protein
MLQKTLKILAYLALALVLLLIVLFKPVDFTPYLETDYYAETKQRYDSLIRQVSTAQGPVSIGLSRVSITPTGMGGGRLLRREFMTAFTSRQLRSERGSKHWLLLVQIC